MMNECTRDFTLCSNVKVVIPNDFGSLSSALEKKFGNQRVVIVVETHDRRRTKSTGHLTDLSRLKKTKQQNIYAAISPTCTSPESSAT